MFPDSKIKNKYQCGHTSTVSMYGNWSKLQNKLQAIAKRGAVVDLLWYGLATDGSSVEDDKLLPILPFLHVDTDSGLIATSLLDIPNINSGLTAQQMYVGNEVREAFSLNWDNCMTYPSDNTNSYNWTT